MRRAAALLLAGLAAPAAADERTWILTQDAGRAFLMYGTPESDDVVLAFSCDPRARTWLVSSFVETQGLKAGRGASMTFVAGARRASLNGIGRSNEMIGSVDVVARGPIDPAVLDLLKVASPLVVEVPGRRETIDTTTLGDKAARFEKACMRG